MPSLAEVADRAHVHHDDARVVLEALFGDGAEIDPADMPDTFADDVLAVLGSAERALAYPIDDDAAALAHDLGLMPQDVLAHIEHRHGLDHGMTEAELGEVVRGDLDHLCERSVPDYWWGTDPEGGKGATLMR